MSRTKKSEPKNKNAASPLLLATTMGMHMVSGVVVGGLIGYGLDKWLDIAPWGMAVFVVIGIMAGFRTIYMDAQRLLKLEESEKKRAEKYPPEN